MKGTHRWSKRLVHDGVDHTSVEGVTADSTLPDPRSMHVGPDRHQKGDRVRCGGASVGHTHTAYAMEMMMDMAAKAASAAIRSSSGWPIWLATRTRRAKQPS